MRQYPIIARVPEWCLAVLPGKRSARHERRHHDYLASVPSTLMYRIILIELLILIVLLGKKDYSFKAYKYALK